MQKEEFNKNKYLNIIYEDKPKNHPNVELQYLLHEKPDLTLDPFVQKIVKEIDKNDFAAQDVFRHKILGIKSTNDLSCGCKSMILYYSSDYIINLSQCGDNCADIFEEITKMRIDNNKSALVQVQHCFQFNRTMFPIYSRYSNQLLNTYIDFIYDYDDWSKKYYGE